jgi:tetratricopeptide (TPR) repeat protein
MFLIRCCLPEPNAFDEALREIRLARQLDPLRSALVNHEAEFLLQARRYDDALATYESGSPEATNDEFVLINRARIAAAKERYSEAIALLKNRSKRMNASVALVYLGRIYALTGEREQALGVLERLREIERAKMPDTYFSHAPKAILYDALGMREQALASLERAFAERDLGLAVVNIEPEYDALRDDPRFQDLLRRINLSQ